MGDVAPLAGAGIEIFGTWPGPFGTVVAPLAGAGIEIYTPVPARRRIPVAPLAGAGIEIILRGSKSIAYSVAPLAGAGIEMSQRKTPATRPEVAPLAGAGIGVNSQCELRVELQKSRSRALGFPEKGAKVSFSILFYKNRACLAFNLHSPCCAMQWRLWSEKARVASPR